MDQFKKIATVIVSLIFIVVIVIFVSRIFGILSDASRSSFKSYAKMILQIVETERFKDPLFDPTDITVDNLYEKLKLTNDNYEEITIIKVGSLYKIVIVGKNRWNGLTAYGTVNHIEVVSSLDYNK